MLNEIATKNNPVSKNTSTKISEVKSCGGFSLTLKENNKSNPFHPSEKAAQKLSNNKILSALPDFDLIRLIPHLDLVFLSSGREIHCGGQQNGYVYFPETAVVSEIFDLADGNIIETAMIGSEGATGLDAILDGNSSTRRALVTIEGKSWRIKTKILEQEFSRPGKIQLLLLDFINRQINQTSQKLICKSFHIIENRLSSWLLMLCDRVKLDRFTLTQENAALLLGANRPSITIAAQTLRRKNLINYSRGEMSILDREGLENSACECYSALKLKMIDI